MTKMITRVVECEEDRNKINYLIEQWEICGWQLKGTPFNFKDGKCWLAFETDNSSKMPEHEK